MAHISRVPFSSHGYWGGGSWRLNREFVGRVKYGVKWMLWNPSNMVHSKFPKVFKEMIFTMLMCHRRRESPLKKLPCCVLYYIFNMLPWDWAGQGEIKERMMSRNMEDEEEEEEEMSTGRFYNYTDEDDEDDEEDEEDEDVEDPEWDGAEDTGDADEDEEEEADVMNMAPIAEEDEDQSGEGARDCNMRECK
mmetsp:Transcript_13125/g.32177  ORF Transcript_13125/g.32177 Transcript_13125/m.32177 type:complete len:192 (-) Transcript_13125:390-965(-)